MKVFLQDNWQQLVGSAAALLFIVVMAFYWRQPTIKPGSSDALQQEAYQAAFKWAAMLSLRSAATDCEKPRVGATEAKCIVAEQLENGHNQSHTRRFQLACSTSAQNNGGCRLIARLP